MNVWGHPKHTIPTLPKMLTFAGVLPLLLSTILVLPLAAPARAMIDTSAALIATIGLSYAAIIGAFLGGIYWGIALSTSKQNSQRSYGRTLSVLYVWSNIVALTSWVGLAESRLIVAVFVVQWLADAWMSKKGLVPQWWIRLRSMVSPLVIVLVICLTHTATLP